MELYLYLTLLVEFVFIDFNKKNKSISLSNNRILILNKIINLKIELIVFLFFITNCDIPRNNAPKKNDNF